MAPQYASSLGKTSNCQSLVSVTLASGEVPVMVGLRLFLPESWTQDAGRMKRARVPKERQAARTKPEIAIEEIDRVIASGTRFGCILADAGYGSSGPFRQALSERGLLWAMGMSGRQNVYRQLPDWFFPKPQQAGVADITSRIARPFLPRRCWPKKNENRSVGGAGPKASLPANLPRAVSGWPMVTGIA